ALNAANVVITHAEVTRIPGTTVQLGEDVARKVLKLMDVLDDQDDVQNVSANFDISDEILEVLRDEG
ncbi:MAG: YebC/PmpR family DNA-binding transcriptional regulator, partial [Candidatus Eisenbacteria bacterium]